MNTQQLLSMLKQQLAKLEQDALIHDQNLAPSQRQSLQEIERFNSQLFAQQGAQLSPCITQLRQDIKQLEKQLYLKLGSNV
ncbi:primosomal replication protein PriC, partial [Psychrobacter sp. GW64-MNA-CIBAN-0177]